MGQATIDLLRRLYADFNRDGVDALYPWMDPAIEWTNSPDSPDHGTWHGHAGVATWFRDFLYAGWESAYFYPDSFDDLGDRVVVGCRVAVRARHDGTEIEVPFAHLITLRGTKVTAFAMFTNRDQAFEAAGVEPREGR